MIQLNNTLCHVDFIQGMRSTLLNHHRKGGVHSWP